ncbi:MAG: hypothetical protein SCK70_05035 [bacterium]|nr:hypothetical protein [bacterium]
MNRKIKSLLGHAFWLVLAALIVGCTSNPLDQGDRIKVTSNIIKGQVKLIDQSSPDGVYVWLEGFDIGQYLDKSGNFSIPLPAAQLQPGGGLNGVFKLYFYLSNYDLKTASIVLQNGKLLPSQGDVNDQGKLRNTIFLPRLLNIEIFANPSTVSQNHGGNITIDLFLEAKEDTVYVEYPDRANGPLAIIFFKRTDPDDGYIQLFENSFNAINSSTYTDSIATDRKHYFSYFKFSAVALPPGSYDIIPYFVIVRESIPDGLLDDFGVDIFKPVVDFVNIPTKRNGGKLDVVHSENLP